MPAPVIEIALHAGVCYGVERALSMAYAAAHDAAQPVHTLGPLIHNPRVVCELEHEGVGLADSVDDASAGTLVIRAHGVVPQVVDEARDRGLHVIDATCPYVKKVHAAAAKLVAQGYQLIVVGGGGHPEVEGILGHAGGAALVAMSRTLIPSTFAVALAWLCRPRRLPSAWRRLSPLLYHAWRRSMLSTQYARPPMSVRPAPLSWRDVPT